MKSKAEKPKETVSSGNSNSVGNIKVVCRVRPPNKKELEQFDQGAQHQCVDFTPDEKTIKLNITEQEKYQFTFDKIYASDTSQQSIYEYAAKPVVQSVLEGYNGTVFAYGQTSSGKTHTMQGPSITDSETKGIIPRMVTTVFQHVNTSPNHIEFRIKLSIVEIYLERIKDLLDPSKSNLAVREDRTRGVYIQDVTEKYVSSEKEVFNIIDQGNQNRSVAYTNMNEGSSRSHMLFIMTIYQNNLEDLSAKSGKLVLVDLAGSEKIAKTGAEGKVLDEAKKINQSLSCLGNVINALTDGKSQHIPYRDSKLTRVLQESLGGNSTTTLIITCSPSSFNDQETLSTLRFGMRAKCIKNKPKINKEYTIQELQLIIQNHEKIIDEQKKTIRSLEKQIENGSFNVSTIQTNSDILNTSQDVLESEEMLGCSLAVDRTMELEAQLEAEKAKCSSYAFQLNQLKNDLSNVTGQMELFSKENEVMANKLTHLAFMLNDMETEMINNKFNMEKSQSSKQSMMQQISSFRKIQESYKQQFAGTINNHFNKNQRIIELVGDDVQQINKDLLLVCQTKLSEEEFKLLLNQMIVQKNSNTEEVPIADFNKLQEQLEEEKTSKQSLQQEFQSIQEENAKLLKIQEQLQSDLQSKNIVNEEASKEINEIQLNKERQQFKLAKDKILEDLKEKVNKVLILEQELEKQKSLSNKQIEELQKREMEQKFKIEFLEKNLERQFTMHENLLSKVMLDKKSNEHDEKLKKKNKQIKKLQQKLNESQIIKEEALKRQLSNKMNSFHNDEEEEEDEQHYPQSTTNILNELNNDIFQNNFVIGDDGNDTDKTEVNRTDNSSEFSEDVINNKSEDQIGNEFMEQINAMDSNQNEFSEFKINKKKTSQNNNNKPNRSSSTRAHSPTSRFGKPQNMTNLQLDFSLIKRQNSSNINDNLNTSYQAHRKGSEVPQNKSQFNTMQRMYSQSNMKQRGSSSQSLNTSFDHGHMKNNQPMSYQKIQNQLGFDIQEVDDDNVSEAYNNMNNPSNFAFNNGNRNINNRNPSKSQYHHPYQQQQQLQQQYENYQMYQQQQQQSQQSYLNYNNQQHSNYHPQFQQQQNQQQQQQHQYKQLPVKVNSLNTQGLNITSNNPNYPFSTDPSSRQHTTSQTTRRKWEENTTLGGDDNDYYNILKSTETEANINTSEALSSHLRNPITPKSTLSGQSNQKNLPFVDYMMNQQKNYMQNIVQQRKNTNNFNSSQVNTTETSDSGKANNKKANPSVLGNPALSPFINSFSFKLLNLQTNCIQSY